MMIKEDSIYFKDEGGNKRKLTDRERESYVRRMKLNGMISAFLNPYRTGTVDTIVRNKTDTNGEGPELIKLSDEDVKNLRRAITKDRYLHLLLLLGLIAAVFAIAVSFARF